MVEDLLYVHRSAQLVFLDVLAEISFRELVLLLGSFLYIADDVLVCGLVTTRMLGV